MLIYFRKASEKSDKRRDWLRQGLEDLGKAGDTYDEVRKQFAKEKFINHAQLYYIEKGDDVYGVYSYTIGQFAVVDFDEDCGEITVVPSSDPEWDDAAKTEFYRIIEKGSLDELGYKELRVDIAQENISEKKAAEEAGFYKADDINMEGFITYGIKKHVKILVTGVNSDLGYEVIQELIERGIDVVGCDNSKEITPVLSAEHGVSYVPLDMSVESAVMAVFKEYNPTAVINCYSWARVDDAELLEYQEDAYRDNVETAKNLAKACRSINAKMMQLTSDYVFNGSGTDAWDADCKAYAPLNYYGKTKAEAEMAVSSILTRYFIVRTEWAFCEKSRNFVDLLLEFAKKRNEITVVDDQVGTPTYYKDLAVLLADMIDTEKYGFYNATNSGDFVSRNEYAKEIFRIATELGHSEYGEDRIHVEEVTSREYRLSRAIRPLNSRLDISKIEESGFAPLPDWRDALKRYLANKDF